MRGAYERRDDPDRVTADLAVLGADGEGLELDRLPNAFAEYLYDRTNWDRTTSSVHSHDWFHNRLDHDLIPAYFSAWVRKWIKVKD